MTTVERLLNLGVISQQEGDIVEAIQDVTDERLEVLKKRLMAGLITANDARRKLGLEPWPKP